MSKSFHVALLVVVFLGGCDVFNPESKNARLTELTVTGGNLSPAFSSGTLQYALAVDAATSSTTVSVKTADKKAKVSINGANRSRRSTMADVTLGVGSTQITVEVTAENGNKHKTYTIDVTRPAPTYSIGGSVTGLTGSLTLQNNGADDLTITADGPYSFATSLADGTDYDVTVLSQPVGQNCTVANGTGTLSGGDVTDVDITCVSVTYTVGGQLSGLSGSVTLQNNGGDDLVLTADGGFTFSTALNDGSNYDVTVSSQPASQECTVTNGSGTISGADVTDVAVACSDIGQFRVGGTINGLVGDVTLQLNGIYNLLAVRNGTFAFLRPFVDGAAYDITVLTQPDGQTCTVSNGSGAIAGDHAVDTTIDCSGAGMAAGSIFDWDWVNPLPQGNGIAGFAADGAQVVAVGANGLVQTSPDGLNWTTRDAGTGDSLTSVVWGDGEFVAVGSGGVVMTSADGVTWQTQNLGFYYFTRVIWNGSLYVAVGSADVNGQGLIATSTDGDNWSFQTINAGDFSFISDVTWSGSLFAAVGYRFDDPDLQALVHTSPDGLNWTTANIGALNRIFNSIASNGSGFMAVGDGGEVLTSPDGATWTQQASAFPYPPASELNWDGTQYVGVGYNGYALSADGTSWTPYTVSDPSDPVVLASITQFGGLNIAGTITGAIYTSPDDVSWTTPFSNNLEPLWDVIWDGSQFVAVGTGPTIYTSPDGTVWTARLTTDPIVAVPQRVIRAGGQYVVVGNGTESQVLTSPDAITWTSHTPSNSYLSLSSVAWGNNLYVAVGGQGTVLTSPDGTTWSGGATGFGSTDQLYDVVWNGSVWAVSGFYFNGPNDYGGFIALSSDGMDWTRHDLPTLVFTQGLEWNGSLFVSVGTAIVTSTDGMNWSTLETNASVNDVTWSGSEFIAVGFGAEILSSADGLTWIAARSRSGSYSGVASDGTTTVVVGSQSGGVLVKGPP